MKWCQHHWDMLRDGIKARRMWHFVPESGQEAAENIVLELEGHGTAFDPLMGAMWQLTERVLENIKDSSGPLEALGAFGDPEWCPMCTVQKSYDWFDDPEQNKEGLKRGEHHLDAQEWIGLKLDSAVTYVKQQGWKFDFEE